MRLNKTSVITVGLLVVAIAATMALLSLRQSNQWFNRQKSLIPSPLTEANQSPRPTSSPLPHGKFSFSVTQSDKTKPLFSGGVIDPYDPAFNQIQTVTVNVSDKEPITQVSAKVKTDSQLAGPFIFKLIDGTAINGTWQGSWAMTDTYDQTFHLIISAVSRRGESLIDITIR
jgi:hypothetical protein